MRKLYKICAMLFSIAIVVCIVNVSEADAASSSAFKIYKDQTSVMKAGDYYFGTNLKGDIIASKNKASVEKKTAKVIAKKPADKNGNTGYVDPAFMTNGKVVYYGSGYNHGSAGTKYLYKVDVTGKNKVLLRTSNVVMEPVSYYNGYLYCEVGQSAEKAQYTSKIGRLKVSTKGWKILKTGVKFEGRYGQYMLCMPSFGEITFNDHYFYVYNVKTDKWMNKVAKGVGENIYDGKIYYAYIVNGNVDEDNAVLYNIRKCNVNGSSKTTIVKNFKATNVCAVTKNYVYYGLGDADGMKYYQYNMNTKKHKEVKFGYFAGLISKHR